MTRPGAGAPGRKSHNPTPREVLAQATPPAATLTGAGQGGARTVRCTDFGGALGDHAGPGPMQVSLFNIVFPPPPRARGDTHISKPRHTTMKSNNAPTNIHVPPTHTSTHMSWLGVCVCVWGPGGGGLLCV